MSETPSFFAELKRRNVLRVAAFYAAAGWLLVQITTQVFPFFNVPNEVVRGVVVVIAIGFPFALGFSWFYELTPQGLKRESEVPRDQSITHHTGRNLDRWIIAVLVLLVIFLLLERFLPNKPAATAPVAPVASGVAAPATNAEASPTPASTVAPAKSIAVLPFENLSEDKANAYFATGMQDEILTRLASIRDLKVISRTSTLKYQSHPEDLRTVGTQLGVASVLEGSVQRAGEQVHINLQLIDARDDSHLWAQSYDREIKDIFAVERDIAQSVADALKAQLMPAEATRVAAAPTQNPAAYDLYLRGMAHFNKAYDQDVLTTAELPQAIALFEQALAADPKFALADAQLAYAHVYMHFTGADRSEARLAAAKTAVDRALALQPDLGEAHLAFGIYYYWGRREYAPALEQLRIAREALPNSADVVTITAAVARRQNRWDEAITGFRQATLLDPRSSIALDQLALAYANLRRYAEADRAFSQAVALAPDPADERMTHAINTVAWRGDLAPLRAAVSGLTTGSDAYVGNAMVIWTMHWYERDYAAATAIAESPGNEAFVDSANIVLPRNLYLAWAHRAAGNPEAAKTAATVVLDSTRAALVKQPEDAFLHLALGLGEAELGHKDDALREGRQALALLPPSRDAVTGSGILIRLATLEVRVGETDAAFDHLRQALALSSGTSISPSLLKLDPVWDPIRNDPRFAQLLTVGERPVEIATKP
ncbi:MAG TPA: tetratricopeptide repeat protein [Rudaea sp.]|nr:tetratricopeptide repeat protein [Rudaea sp.]